MDSLELVKDLLTGLNDCDGLYIEEIIGIYNGEFELPFILDTIAQSLRAEHTHAVDCLNGTKIVISDKGKDFLNIIFNEGRFEKFMNLKKALFDLVGDAHEKDNQDH